MHPEHGTEPDLGKLIKAVADFGEQARLLALNLAVAAAKLKLTQGTRRQLDDDLFSMVTRMTNLARQVAEVAAVAEKGYGRQRQKVGDRLLRLLLEKGVYNEDVMVHMERSLYEVLALAERIAEHIGAPMPESCRTDTPQTP